MKNRAVPTLIAALIALVLHGSLAFLLWTFAQLLPITWPLRINLQSSAWRRWDDSNTWSGVEEATPVVIVPDHKANLSAYLEVTYGTDWRTRPLVFRGLSTAQELHMPGRRLSMKGLLKETLEVPYFTDARQKNALTPDAEAPIGEIVANISKGLPHKIGTQLFLRSNPEVISEVAPLDILTELFGAYFTPEHIKGFGPLPGLTTVPLFISSGRITSAQKPFTALHCEPIGNVAVQLSGSRKWTLVQPKHWRHVQPSLALDGRAYFPSWIRSSPPVPRYSVITHAGDAVWVPTWTWHQVDYLESPDVSIGASLFHFRPVEFVKNNPTFAILVIPALIRELLGYSSQ